MKYNSYVHELWNNNVLSSEATVKEGMRNVKLHACTPV